MDLLLEKLWNFVARDKSLTLQVRLFRLMCLTTAIMALFVILPINLLETSLPLVVNLADIALGSFAVFCYSRSHRGINHIKTFLLVLVLLLDAVWFFNGGITGSVTYFFFAVIMFPLVMCRGWTRWAFAGFVMLNVATLMLAEYFFPNSVTRLTVRSEWFTDNFTGILASFVAISLVIWVIVTSYDWERSLLSRSTKELAVSEENYRSVVENAMSIILRLDTEGRITFFNKFAENVFGYQRGEIVGRHMLGTILSPVSSKGENLAEKINELLQHPERHATSENENVCRDGRRIWVTWTNQPIYDEQHRLKEILCVGADVTERVALLEQLRLTQITMDAAAEQILWTNDAGRIIYANAAAIAELGYSTEELCKMTLSDLTVDFPAAAWNDRWRALKRDRSARFELTQRFKNGATHPVELSATYIKVADKEYTTVFIRDLTERNLAEEKRRQHEHQMQHLQRLESLGLLAGGIAHDFNNLLTAILGNISLVKMDLPASSENHELLGEAEKASSQAKGLTAQLLTFAKGGKPVKSAVNLEHVIRDSTSFALRGTPVKCLIHVAEGLRLVEADPTQLAQVFNNLVLNACQAMPDGGQITIHARNRVVGAPDKLLVTAGDYVEVTIHDEGVGIAPEHLEKVFDPYFTTKKAGTGLGLAVVHSIVSNHQGAVLVNSQPGRGTTFTLLLPVSRQVPVMATKPEMSVAAQRHRILIMDDEQMICRLLAKLLSRFGYDAETVPDGGAALSAYQQAAAQKNPFDLVITDLTVPGGMGGLETLRRLLEINPHVKVVVSSGYSSDPVLAEHQTYGFKGVILKPYTQEQVQAAVHDALAE